MERMIVRVLSLLRSGEHNFEKLKLKLSCPSDKLGSLLEWGETQKLWLKNPISQAYMISDTGELILERSMIKDMLKAYPLRLDKPEFDRILRNLKHVKLCLMSLKTS